MKLTPAETRAVMALAVGMFCVQVDFFALNLALLRMAVDLNETTTNMQWVISAALQGLGAAALFTVSVAAISNAVARDHRAVAIGLLSESRILEPHSARSSADF
jgi:MFS family permease